jgi:tRNA(Ile)-lysidine synthase TilS/MesJ
MKANYEGERGIRVIRPFVYVRESATKAFAQENRLPIINENCPACLEQPKERARVKKMLAKEESLYPVMYTHLKRGLVPLMGDRIYDVMKVRP